jgi:hypothetical protein
LKVILSTACALLSVAALADTLEAEAQPKALQLDGQAQPSANQLLRDVVAGLPMDPIHVSGELLVRKRRGVPVASFGFELDADWGATPAQASYRIRDAFGQTLEQLTITHDRDTAYQYATGDPLQPAELPNLSGSIQGTDLSWIDLTLAYLWWPGGKIAGEESIRSFDCYIVDIPAPGNGSQRSGVRGQKSETEITPHSPQSTPPSPQSTYSRVRLWIGKKARMMLQAEGYDANDEIVRRLWVRSCKKVDDQWIIKDMEVQHYPVVHRTKLRVNEVKAKNP